MPHSPYKTIAGTVTHIFGHRFILRTEDGDLLADLTPKGREQIELRLNDAVVLEGEMKPYEHHPHADPSIVLAAAHAAGFEVLGSPRRKPKHFEVLGKKKGEFNELHIELDGHIRKSRPVANDDQKWSSELRGVT